MMPRYTSSCPLVHPAATMKQQGQRCMTFFPPKLLLLWVLPSCGPVCSLSLMVVAGLPLLMPVVPASAAGGCATTAAAGTCGLFTNKAGEWCYYVAVVVMASREPQHLDVFSSGMRPLATHHHTCMLSLSSESQLLFRSSVLVRVADQQCGCVCLLRRWAGCSA
jgi:hypothetical protein